MGVRDGNWMLDFHGRLVARDAMAAAIRPRVAGSRARLL
jgi:hypothetical protein